MQDNDNEIPEIELLDQDQILIKAEKYFSGIKGNEAKMFESIKLFCRDIKDYDVIDRGLYINSISKKFKIHKKLFNDTMAAIDRDASESESENTRSSVNLPKISLIEEFISKNFEVRYNVIANKFEARDFQYKDTPAFEWSSMNEYNILRRLRKSFINTTLSETIEILKSDFTPIHNPLQEYFENLEPWDEKTDWIAKLGSYLTIDKEDKDRFKRMWEKLFPRMIACSLEMKFNKQAFIFIGKGIKNQNMGKTTFLRWLIPYVLRDYYTEEIPRDKDALIALCENIIVNLDELATLGKQEINWLKSMMSKDWIKVRLPYDRRSSTLKRRCNFVGSTNEPKFLTDLTGNVRWIGFYVNDINFDYSKDIDINKVWAQAYHYLLKGKNGQPFDIELTPAEIKENDKANLEFMNLPPEMELIPKYYSPGNPGIQGSNYHDIYTASDFVKHLSEKTNNSIKFYSVSIGRALRNLGFEQKSVRNDDSQSPFKAYYVKFLQKENISQVVEDKDLPF